MTKALHITHDKVVAERTIDGMTDMQDAVGGYFEAIDLPRIDAVMWVNEDGAPDFNSIATDVAGLGGRPDLLVRGITGNVLITGPTGSDHTSTDTTDKARRAVQRVAREATA